MSDQLISLRLSVKPHQRSEGLHQVHERVFPVDIVVGVPEQVPSPHIRDALVSHPISGQGDGNRFPQTVEGQLSRQRHVCPLPSGHGDLVRPKERETALREGASEWTHAPLLRRPRDAEYHPLPVCGACHPGERRPLDACHLVR
jgi:hypothetical protein